MYPNVGSGTQASVVVVASALRLPNVFLCSHKAGKTAEVQQCQLMLATKGTFVEWATKKNSARGTGFFATAEGSRSVVHLLGRALSLGHRCGKFLLMATFE
jgi:hypothetical protein